MKLIIIRRIIVSAILLLNLQPSSSRPIHAVSKTKDVPLPSYSLYETRPYEFPVYSRTRGVKYYVRLKDYKKICSGPSSQELRQKIEESVERDHFGILMRGCQFETQQLLWGFIRDTPHCTLLQDFALEDYSSIPPPPKSELL